MEYRKLGSNEKVSILGFGCMRLPLVGNKINKDKSIELFQYAFDNGINYYDTAWPYHGGNSEYVLGEFIKTVPREKIYIADKMPVWEIKTYDDLDVVFEKQLEKVGVDYFDYYLLHALNEEEYENVKKKDMVKWIQNKKREGKIKNIGFSFHDKYEIFEKIVDLCKWDFVQIQLNYIDEEYQAGIKGLKYAQEREIDVVIMEPLRGGVLAKSTSDVLNIINSAQDKKTPVEWALRYLFNKEAVSVVLSGMNEIEHLKENIEISNNGLVNSLTGNDEKIILELQNYYFQKIKVPCTGCGYCMPCPNGVDIPLCFSYYNASEKVNGEGYFQYNAMVEDHKRAGKCIKCGLCEQKCPQGIKIMKSLEEVTEYFN